MLEKPPFTDQQITDCLKIHYAIEAVALSFLPLGADINASVYKATARDQSSYFIKLKRGSLHDVSIDILNLLHHAGIQHIIPPIYTIQGQSILHMDHCSLTVYPFIEGQDGFSRDLTDAQWLILGETLRKIHDLDVPLPIQQKLRQETYSPKWREIVQALCEHITTSSSHIAAQEEIALKLLTFMRENIATIRQLVDRAEQLAQKHRDNSAKFVLCHADIHGGNVLIGKNDTIYMVDWDDPIMAPRERDLMFIGGGVGLVWNKPREEALFYKGYGKTGVNKEMLAYYRHERIVEDIAIYAQALLFTTTGGANRLEMYKHFIAMFEPNGVVEIALNTDKY